MKNNKVILLIGIILIGVIILSYFTIKDNKITDDEKNFAVEYENFNGKKSLTSGKKYMEVKIPEKNGVEYISGEKVIEILREGTGVVYFGFPECPWCRNMIVPLLEVMQEEGEKVYYYNAYSIRDDKDLDENGNIVTYKEGTENYYKILELLGDKADVYEGLNDDSIKRLYFPTVVFVKHGKVVDKHVSTVDSQKTPFKKLNNKQIKELKDIYRKNIKKMRNNSSAEICTGKESC